MSESSGSKLAASVFMPKSRILDAPVKAVTGSTWSRLTKGLSSGIDPVKKEFPYEKTEPSLPTLTLKSALSTSSPVLGG